METITNQNNDMFGLQSLQFSCEDKKRKSFGLLEEVWFVGFSETFYSSLFELNVLYKITMCNVFQHFVNLDK